MDDPADRNLPRPPRPVHLSELEIAERTVAAGKILYSRLWAEVKRMAEYRRMLATRERCQAFEAKILRAAEFINLTMESPMTQTDVEDAPAAWPVESRCSSTGRSGRGSDG